MDASRIKAMNTDTIRRALRQNAHLSKSDFMRSTGLSFSTVSRLVDALVLSGELRENGPGGSTGGRRAQVYSVNPVYQVTLTLLLEADSLLWSVNDLNGDCLEEGGGACENGLLEAIDQLLVQIESRYPQLGAVAVSVAGTLYQGTVTELFGCRELRGINLPGHIRERFRLPAAVEGDVFAASIGYCSRCAEVPRAVVCVCLSRSGIGAGLSIGGSVWRGASEFAGELHYLPIEGNLDYARTRFAGADMADYYGKILRSYIALVNPDRIVLYENDLIAGKADAIRQKATQGIPSQAIPQIELSGDFSTDCRRGLLSLAYGLLGRP